jgi:hypothetical protein
MIIKNEKELLNLFVDEHDIRPNFHEPFLNTKYESEVWATDGYSLLIVNHECLSGEYPTQEITMPKLMDKNCTTVITQDALRIALSECPQVDEEIRTGEYKKCKECGGRGEVEWEYFDNKDFCHQRDFDCPCCDGSGYSDEPITKKTGKKVPDKRACVLVDTMIAAVGQMSRLLKAMELLGVDEVRHTITSKKDTNLFIVNDDIKILIMPYMSEGISAIVKTRKGDQL